MKRILVVTLLLTLLSVLPVKAEQFPCQCDPNVPEPLRSYVYLPVVSR